MDAKAVQKKGKTGKADQGLAFIQKLYALERAINEQPPDERYRRRQAEAKPIIDKLRAWLEKGLPHVPPQSAIGKALHYLHSQRSEEHTSELQSRGHLVCRLLLEKKKTTQETPEHTTTHHYRL